MPFVIFFIRNAYSDFGKRLLYWHATVAVESRSYTK